jgi:hypothetical protein
MGRRLEQVMGMPVAVDVRDDDVDPAAVEEVFARLGSRRAVQHVQVHERGLARQPQ